MIRRIVFTTAAAMLAMSLSMAAYADGNASAVIRNGVYVTGEDAAAEVKPGPGAALNSGLGSQSGAASSSSTASTAATASASIAISSLPSAPVADTDADVSSAKGTAADTTGTSASSSAEASEISASSTGTSTTAAGTAEMETGTAGTAASQAETSSQTATDTASTSSEASTEVTAAVSSVGSLELNSLDVPETAAVLAVLEGGRNTDSGTFTLLIKKTASDGSTYWTKALETPAKYGMNGLYKKKEGDARTPVGVFKMNVPFGIRAAEEGFPENYLKVDSNYYWNGDSDSDRYNQLVNVNEYNSFNKLKSEHLINYGGYYDYCINTGYNPDGTAHRGSAIFLHCMVNNSNTHGCIGIASDSMKEVLRSYQEGSTYMVIFNRDAPQELYKQQ